ncbi:hypothetical protein WDU94_008930 [Cyamophila willieti]
MAVKILSYQKEDEDYERTVRVKMSKEKVERVFRNEDLSYFITAQSSGFFEKLNISTNILHQDPSTWHEDEDYLKGFGLVAHFKVVNDTAERGVKLIQDFSHSLTHNEKQKTIRVTSCFRVPPTVP